MADEKVVVFENPARDGKGIPDVYVCYKNLSYTLRLTEKQADRTMNTVPAVLMSAFAAPVKGLASLVGLGPKREDITTEFKVLDKISGVIRPGSMTLLLAPPGAGKTAFLKSLASVPGFTQKLDKSSSVTYNGDSPAELKNKGIYPGQLVQYVDQLDNHMPFLTVRETFEFIGENALAGVDSEGVDARVNDVINLLHLKNAENTLIGNDLLRGVSGGEKKRVTIGEGIMTRARVLCLDEISTGLDSAVTFSVVHSLRERARSERLAVIIALLQPTPEVYELFDDVILLKDGCTVYHGSRSAIPEYMTSLGFQPPKPDLSSHGISISMSRQTSAATDAGDVGKPAPISLAGMKDATSLPAPSAGPGAHADDETMDIADWLAELLSFPNRTHAKDLARANAAKARLAGINSSNANLVGMSLSPVPSAASGLDTMADKSGVDAAHKTSTSAQAIEPPMTTAAMVAAWKASSMYLNSVTPPSNMPKLDIANFNEASVAQYGRPYAHAWPVHTWSVVKRQWILLMRNKLFIGFRVFSAIFMAFVFGGLYWQQGVADGLNFYGLFLNAGMHVAFANISEMSSAVENKYIAYRHTANNVHPVFSYPLAAIITHLPVAILESLSFSAISYFMCGLTPEAGQFFFFFLVVLMMDIFASILFRTFAYSAPHLVAAQAGPMPLIALMILFAGFMITPSKMPVWLGWLYYVDIFGWAIRSLAQNEFYSDRYNFNPTGVPGSATMGELYLKFFDMELNKDYKWAGIGYSAGVIILVSVWSFWAFTNIRFDRNVGSARHKADEIEPSSAAADDSAVPRGLPSSGSLATITPSVAAAALSPSTPINPSPSTTTVAPSSSDVALDVPKVDVRSVLPFTPMTVAFQDIMYTVDLPPHMGGGKKTLLQGINGYALPGRMIALMGASGAGKTTLLDVLASRKNSGAMTGAVFLNGHPKEEATFSRITAYVEQQDMHFPLTTVLEALEFSAAMRLPDGVTAEQRAAFVKEVMDILELTPIADRKVGDVGSADGLAPGERKRLTIGVELVSNAPVIFLDEPTSGLDARAAAIVMKVIKNVASTGRTVICTIHQPSAELFFLFDDLLLLQRGGWQVYFGQLGRKGHDLVKYLAHVPGTRPLPKGQNPASWMLDVLGGTDSSGGLGPAAASQAPAGGAPVVVVEQQKHHRVLTGTEYQQHLFESHAWKHHNHTLELLCKPIEGVPRVAFTTRRARSWFQQYFILVGRHARNYNRNIPFNLGRLGALTGLSILFGIIWYAIGEKANDIAGVQSLVAAIFMISAFAGMMQMDTAMPVLIKSRVVFYREQASLMYDSFAYTLSLLSVEIPWVFGILMVVVPIGYFMLGLLGSAFLAAPEGVSAASTYFFHFLVTFIQALVFVGLGQFIAAAAPSFDVAQAIIGTCAPVLFLFGGMFSPPSKMPPGSRWVNVIDPIGYAFRALIPPQFHCPGGAAAGCPQMTVPDPVHGIVTVDRYTYVENLYDFKYEDRWAQVGYLAIFVAVFQAGNMLATRYIRHIVR